MRNKTLLAASLCLVIGLSSRGANAQDAATIEPTLGLWEYDEFDAATNTCKSDEVVSDGDGTFMLAKNADGSFQVHPGDGTDAFKCSVKGSVMDCPERAGFSHDLRSTGVDAKLTGKAVATGTFADGEHMKGQQIATFTCEGSACAVAAMALGTTFPCKVTIDFEAKLKSAK